MGILESILEDDTIVETLKSYIGKSTLISLAHTCKILRKEIIMHNHDFSTMCILERNLNLLEWVYEGWGKCCENHSLCHEINVFIITYLGYEEILLWYNKVFGPLTLAELPLSKKSDINYINHIAFIFLSSGNHVLLKLLHERYNINLKYVAARACCFGQIEILKWVSNLHPLDLEDCLHTITTTNFGSFRILKWLRKYSLENNLDDIFMKSEWVINVVENGNVEMINFFYKQGCIIKDLKINRLGRNFNLNYIRYISSMGMIFGDDIYERAVLNERVDIITCLIENGHEYSDNLNSVVSKPENYLLMKLLYEYGIPGFDIEKIFCQAVQAYSDSFRFAVPREDELYSRKMSRKMINWLGPEIYVDGDADFHYKAYILQVQTAYKIFSEKSKEESRFFSLNFSKPDYVLKCKDKLFLDKKRE